MARTGTGTGRVLLSGGALVLALGTAPVAPAGAVECVRPGGGGGCWPTVQQGIDAASPGETVLVRPGVYRENIVAGKAVSVVGGGRSPAAVVVDGGRTDGVATARVTAAGVRFENLTLRQGDPTLGVEAGGAGARVARAVVTASLGSCVEVAAAGLAIVDSTISRCVDSAVTGNGATTDGFLLKRSTVRLAGSDCIAVRGAGTRVLESSLASCGGVGIVIDGDGAVVRATELRNTGDDGVVIDGGNPAVRGSKLVSIAGEAVSLNAAGTIAVTGNTVRKTGEYGIYAYCDACTGGAVSGNSVRDSFDDGISIQGAGAAVLEFRENVAEWVSADAIRLDDPVFARVAANAARHAGNECYAVYTGVAGALLRGNAASDCGRDGFAVHGDGNTFLDNTVSGALYAGFVVSASGVGNGFQGNTVKRSLTKFCDQGVGTVLLGGNNFSGSVCP